MNKNFPARKFTFFHFSYAILISLGPHSMVWGQFEYLRYVLCNTASVKIHLHIPLISTDLLQKCKDMGVNRSGYFYTFLNRKKL